MVPFQKPVLFTFFRPKIVKNWYLGGVAEYTSVIAVLLLTGRNYLSNVYE
jgi:hypothetical protein